MVKGRRIISPDRGLTVQSGNRREKFSSIFEAGQTHD